MPFDEGAKDVTRVFYTTTASEEDLLFLSSDLFDLKEAPWVEEIENEKLKMENSQNAAANSQFSILDSQLNYEDEYDGVP